MKIIEVLKGCAKGLLIIVNLLVILNALCSLGFAAVDIKILQNYGEEQAGGCFKGDIIIIVLSVVVVAVATVGCVGAAKDSVKMLQLLNALCSLGFAAVDIKILQNYGEEQAGGCFKGDIIIIVLSVVVVAVATVGCVGAAKDSVKMLQLYVGFVLLLVVLELMIAIFVSIQRYGLQFRVTDWIREDFYKNVTVFESEKHLQTWDTMQSTNECCGLNGPDDYISLGQPIPITCCARAYGARSDNGRKLMYKSCVETESYYETGCEEEVLEILRSDADFLLGVATFAFWFEATGIVLALWVSRQLRNSVQVYKNMVRY